MSQDEHEATVAACIRSRGITRCPTACVLLTQDTIDAADREALQNYAAARSQSSAEGFRTAAISARGQLPVGTR